MTKKKPVARKTASTKLTRRGTKGDYAGLLKAIESANMQMVGRAAVVVNQALVIRNWLIGAYLVEYEQGGADRAKYGAKLLETLAKDLEARQIKGLGVSILKNCRQFFQMYPQIRQPLVGELGARLGFEEIRQPVVGELMSGTSSPRIPALIVTKSVPSRPDKDSVTSGYGIGQPVVDQLKPSTVLKRIPGSVSPELGDAGRSASLAQKSADVAPTPLTAETVLRFSWTQLLEFIRIEDPWKRAFYENECLQGHWSKRQLQRQIESLLYERTGLSTNKKAVVERARRQEPQESIADVLRDPYILEFTGLAERAEYSEDELETALLDHLQRFLLELGRGFCFEARQFRMTEGRKHHRVDLVFYHRLLRCHVLIDLKIRAFQPADAGQMNFYVNWFKANMMAEGDNPPVGILLCSDKDGVEVEFATAGMDQKLFVSRYVTALPSVEQLKAFLDRDRAEIEALTPRKG